WVGDSTTRQPPGRKSFAASASSSPSASICSKTSIYRIESNWLPAMLAKVPHLTEQLETAATFSLSLAASSESGSRHCQDLTCLFWRKTVLTPKPAPTSNTLPVIQRRMREIQYAFQWDACAKSSSSWPM